MDKQQYVAKNPVASEHILRFQVSSVAPFMHNNNDFIFALTKLIGNIKFSGVVRPFAVTVKTAVNI